jgi:UDP-N-acetylmuramoyl-tripeptide--D-alanyl-D-alanine ligase
MTWSRWLQWTKALLSWPQRTFWSSAKVEQCAIWLARQWRPRMRQALVVAVSGSAGKTTTRHLVHALLQSRLGPGVGTPAASFFAFTAAEAVLNLRRRHRFLAAELHEGTPGMMRRIAGIVRPDVAILTVARDDHASAFASKAALFDEMEELLRHVPARGTAILNADDPIVMAMRTSCRGHVMTYGLHENADLRAEAVHSGWPNRLRLTLVHRAAREAVTTRMLGEHWVSSVLAATACGLVAGMTLPEIAEVLARVEPFEGRMQEMRCDDGVIFIRDDYKAPQWTLPACFDFLRQVVDRRKVLVLGEVSDNQDGKELVLQRLVVEALSVADLAVVVGPWSSAVLKLKRGDFAERIFAFTRTRDASAFVNAWLRPGDMVLLKGSNRQNHLSRILLDRQGDIRCWREDCRLARFCRVCDDRLRSVGAPANVIHPMPIESIRATAAQPVDYLVLGLGNSAEPGHADTHAPHNLGITFVDRLANTHGLEWQSAPWGWHADIVLGDQALKLAKMRSSMNQIGPKLMPVLAALGLPPQRCVLVFDDLSLPLGKLALRERGSAGGHRGVASILAAAQTDTFRRLKLGVAPADAAGMRTAEYVLRPFPADALPAIQTMLAQSEDRLLVFLHGLRAKAHGAKREEPLSTKDAEANQDACN